MSSARSACASPGYWFAAFALESSTFSLKLGVSAYALTLAASLRSQVGSACGLTLVGIGLRPHHGCITSLAGWFGLRPHLGDSPYGLTLAPLLAKDQQYSKF